MNCEKVRSKISALSADSLSAREASTMLAHFAACSSCQECWEEYQQMMFVLSSATQPIPGAVRSQQMWDHCKQRITETEIASRYTSPARREALRNALSENNGHSLWSWFGVQPRWGWVALGGVMAALAGTWYATTPAPQPNNIPTNTTAQLFAPSNLNPVDYPPAPEPNQPPLGLPSYNSAPPTVFAAPTAPPSPLPDHRSVIQPNPLETPPSSVVSYTVPENTP
jgi:hypothetical protein